MIKGMKVRNLLRKGQELYWAGNLEAAGEMLEKAYQLDSLDFGVIIYLGLVLNNLGQAERAEELLTKARQLEPENSAGLIFSGLIAYDKNHLNQAESYWREALVREENNPLATAFLSLINLRNSRKVALPQLNSGELYPQIEFLARLLLELEKENV